MMMEVISTRRYEARPPPLVNDANHPDILIDPENSVALVKEEEWETRKKKEITTTRQIETRVKRQVVLEDGEVVEDSGPLVTTNTTEDIEQQEHTTQERRTTGDEPQEVEWPAGTGKTTGETGSILQKESNETVVRSREEIEERLETEDRQQLGDISDEAYQKAVRSNRGDIRVALAESSKQLTPQTGPRVIQHTTRSNKVIDTEKTLERKELKADGLIVTEKKQTVEHEEIKDDEVPDEGKDEGSEEEVETRKEGIERYSKKREEDVVDYVSATGERVARQMRYVAETTEGERIGDYSPPPTMRTTRLYKHSGFPTDGTPGRKDVLTKKPLDLEEEDEARKFETSKWLESHFGSESRSSHGSIDAEDSPIPPTTNTTYINVTMKSRPSKDREYQNVNSSRYHQHRSGGRDSASPSGYFHGISEWSERHQAREKKSGQQRTSSPSHYVEFSRTNGHLHEHSKNQVDSAYSKSYESVRRREHQESIEERRTPSPPTRRRPAKDQYSSKSEEKTTLNEPSSGRTASPVHVVQRTWENRSRDVQNGERDQKKAVSRSRSISPKPSAGTRDEKKTNEAVKSGSKGLGHSKYKIGESFRKLVGKLRSASTERKNKRSSSTSQLTQTEDNGPTYLQYNVVDKNIPLVTEIEDKPPEKPPRSPRNRSSIKTSSRTNDQVNHEQNQRNESTPPLQRYYLGEDPFGGSIYGREKGYGETKRSGRSRPGNRIETEYSSLDRFSKSTSRTPGREKEDHRSGSRSLPRDVRSGESTYFEQIRSSRQIYSSTFEEKTSSRGNANPVDQTYRNGGTINVSFKSTPTENLRNPDTLEYRRKSMSPRSKSFDTDRDEVDLPSRTSRVSSLQSSRLCETPPLKSPSVLASIRRSNRNLFKDSNRDVTPSSSLGRFSKSTSKLANGHEKQEYLRSSQTLPRNLHSTGARSSEQQSRSYHRQQQPSKTHMEGTSRTTITPVDTVDSTNRSPHHQYGSMINISIKNAVTSSHPKATQTLGFEAPAKPQRTYKSVLSRSKSFNVEAGRNHPRFDMISPSPVSYTSNIQLHRFLDETPPLKSPGILASISRSNKDLFKDTRLEY